MKQHWLDEIDGLIIEGDILEALALLEDESVESIVTDPPYELKFMGKTWDDQGISFRAATWKACLRVLKPGGHMIAFGGTRTHHHMWVAIEDAGFEVRDMVLWMYGQGFPKSMDVSKAIDKAAGEEREVVGDDPNYRKRVHTESVYSGGQSRPKYLTASATDDAKKWNGWGTALKPACEPILLARKPLSEKTVAANVLKHSTGALNIDATRLTYQNAADKESATPQGRTTAKPGRLAGKAQGGGERTEFERPEQKGRWPSNIVLQCTCDNPQSVPETVRERHGEPSQERRYDEEGATNLAAKPGTRREGGGLAHDDPDCPAGMLDTQTGDLKSGMMNPGQQRRKTKGGGGYHGNMPNEATAVGTYGDIGGASRFFYRAKTTKKEREAGLIGHLACQVCGEVDSTTHKNEKGDDIKCVRNNHPTVKPIALMRWLIRLVTPPDGVVLDPFCGSGSTLVAAADEGFGFIGIDISPEYCEIARERLKGRKS